MLDPTSAIQRLFAQPIAHRGLHAGGGSGPVENSLGAAEAAIGSGYAIECDVQASRDGEAMVFHDWSLERLTDATGPVAAREAAALQAELLRAGRDHIATLAELLATIGGRVPLVIEIKSENGSAIPLVDRILTVLDGYAGPVALESFDPIIVLSCRKSGTRRPVGLVGPPEHDADVNTLALETSDFLSWSIDCLEEAARLLPSRPRSTWTVRTPAQALAAASFGAQIVFEGFTPSPSVNRVKEQ